MGSKAFVGGDVGRRAERLAVDANARMKPNDWSSLEIRILDVSALGFRAQCEARLQPGGSVTVEVGGIGSVEAQVEWQRGQQFGARFFQPIDVERCEWRLAAGQATLAQLLVQRAGARTGGRRAAEAQIRRRILATLPVVKGSFGG
jgi:hypothetical protein